MARDDRAVNVPGVTLAIRTGDRVRVDGDRGIVERIEERASLKPPPPADG
jgi:pyruvate,water dikinase